MPASRTLRTSRHVVALSAAVSALATFAAAVDSVSASVPWHLDRIDQRWLPLDGWFDPCATGSGAVDFGDLLVVLSDWGPCDGCREDLDGSGVVDFGDLLVVLSDWGPCD